MKVVYMGTPDFAVSCLDGIVRAGHDVCAVFTQPDKPRGRKMVMTPPDVKVYALEHELDVYQPNTLKDGKAFEIIKELEPDVIVVAAYGKILPKEIIEYPTQSLIQIIKDDKEILIPIHEDIVKNVDREGKKIYIKAPSGLIDMYLGI